MSEQRTARSSAKRARWLAIDIDPQGIFIASGTPGGSARIEQLLAWVPGDEHGPPPLTPDSAQALGEQLRDRLASAGIPAGKALVGIGREKVILKEIRYPAVPAEQEPAIVQFQVAKDLSESPDEAVIDYVPIEEIASGEEGTERRSMGVVLRREVLESIQAMCEAAGLKLAAVTPRPYAVAAAFGEALAEGTAPAASPDAAVAIITIGPAGGEFTVLRRGQVRFARSIPAPVLANEALLLAEVRRNLTVYDGQNPGDGITAIYVAEARHHIGGWAGKLDSLPVPVHTFDPVEHSRATVAEKLHGRFAGAAGLLALKADEVLPINFASPRQPKPAANPRRRQLTLAALAALTLIIAGGGFGYLEYMKADRRLNDLTAQKSSLENELAMREPDRKRFDAADQWSKRSVNYLDELFEMSTRLPEGDRVRVSEFKGTARPVEHKTGRQDAQAAFEIRGGVKSGSAVTALSDAINRDNAGKQKYYIGTQFTLTGVPIPNTAYNQSFTITTKVNHRDPDEYTESPYFVPPTRRGAVASSAPRPAPTGTSPAPRDKPAGNE